MFRISFLTLPKPIVPTGYNGRSGKPITSAALLTLTIDKRRINFPFLITDLGSTDILIGRKFLEHYDLKLDYSGGKNRIQWPDDMPAVPYYDRRLLLCIDKAPRKTNADHQADVARQYSQMEAAEEADLSGVHMTSSPRSLVSPAEGKPPRSKKSQIQSQPHRPSCYIRDIRNRLSSMEELLHRSNPCSPLLSSPTHGSELPDKLTALPPDSKPHSTYSTNISMISASSMHRFYLRSHAQISRDAPAKDNSTFVTSVNEIDAEIKRRKDELNFQNEVEIAALDTKLSSEGVLEAKYQINEDMVKDKLMPQYQAFQNLFSRRASDRLPSHRPNVDHKIELLAGNNLPLEPLRQMTDEQLSETKRYILENLHKGFIAPSNAPHAAPILFAKKADGNLRL